jgi:hypothetical protein
MAYKMARLSEASSRLGRVLAMYPGQTQDILLLSLRDPVFRSLCEDLEDAHASLARLASLPGPGERPEVAEYRTIIAELQEEVRVYLESECS